MWSVVVPLLAVVVELFRNKQAEVAKSTGLAPESVAKVGEAVEAYLTRDERALKTIYDEIERARQHDIALNDKVPPVVELLRGLVRPVITMTAFVWYVCARATGVILGAEDYAIIGGIMAFWFGFRPFEKGYSLVGGSVSGQKATRV